MKVTTFKTLVFVLFVAAAFSCKKSSDDNSTAPKTKTELLTQKPWKIQDAAIDNNKNGNIDAGESVKGFLITSCDLDNTITFKTNNTSVVDEGASKCDPADPQTANYTWSFDANQNNITTNDPLLTTVSTGTAKVLVLDENTMKLSTEGNFMGAPVTLLLLLQH